MRRRKWVIVLVVLTAFALILYWRYPTVRRDGPIYNDRHLSEWVEIYGVCNYGGPAPTVAHGPQDEEAAEAAIRKIGTNAFPHLLKWLQWESGPSPSKLPAPVERFMWRNPKLQRLFIPRSRYRPPGSVAAFRLLRTNVNPATLQELMRLMNTPGASVTQYRAACILSEVALPALLTVLRDPQHPSRGFAVNAVNVLDDPGPFAEELTYALIACLDDHNTQFGAVCTLVKLNRFPQLSVPALVGCLQSRDMMVRKFAAVGLGNFSADAVVALPALTNLLDDPVELIRQEATNAIGKIVPRH
jgi:hypothetical protein